MIYTTLLLWFFLINQNLLALARIILKLRKQSIEMKLHSVFSKEFYLWWLIMAVCSILAFSIFGLPEMSGYEESGMIFWIIGTLFTSLVFGSIVYLIYSVFAGKWNNKAYIIIISIMFVFTTILLLAK